MTKINFESSGFIALSNICTETGLSKSIVLFFVDEGIVSIKDDDENLLIDSFNAEKLRAISRLKNELGVNNEGISVIMGMRERIIDYQRQFKIISDSIKNSNSVDEIIAQLNDCGFFE
jgi:hypothetical protein